MQILTSSTNYKWLLTSFPTIMISIPSSNFGYKKFIRRCGIGIASALLCAAFASCSSSKSTVATGKFTPSDVDQIEATHKLNGEQKKIIEEAYTWLGTPYVYAAQEKGVGADCSGMVMEVYRATLGQKLPRNSAKQAEFCVKVDEKEANVGDLIFFATGKDPDRISHVGIVVDADYFIHASTSKGVVVSKIHTPYYLSRLKMYGRVPRNRASRD